MRVLLKWVGIICLIPIVLVLLLAVLLYIPPFQRFVINKAIGYANQATGMEISVREIRIGFPLKLKVEGAQVILPPADTLLLADKMTADIRPLPLLKKEVYFSGFDLQNISLNTDTLINGMQVIGQVGKINLDLDHIDLNKEEVFINGLDLSDARISLFLKDTTTKQDTVSAPARWIVEADRIDLTRVSFDMSMPADTTHLNAYIDQASLHNGKVDLLTANYTVDLFSVSNSTVNYDQNELAPQPGLDPAHIALNSLNITLQDIAYTPEEIKANINQLSVQERSGLTITSLNGSLQSDTTTIEIPDLQLETTDSQLRLMATVPWSILGDKPEGSARAMLRGTIGKADLLRVAPQLSEDLQSVYPNEPLSLTAGIEGNTSALHIRQLRAELRGTLRLNATGDVYNITEDNRSGNLKFQAETGNVDFIRDFLPDSTRQRVRIPPGIRLSGDAAFVAQDYQARILMTESNGSVRVNGRYNMASEAYTADVRIDNLQPIHFLPQDSLMLLTANIKADGRGTDIYSASTRAHVEATIADVRYGSMELTDVSLKADLVRNNFDVELHSDDPKADLDLSLTGILERNHVEGTLVADVDYINFNTLQLMSDTLVTSFQAFGQVESDLQKNHNLDLTVGNWMLMTPGRAYEPDLLTLHVNTSEDTTRVSLHTGDLGVIVTGNADPQTMISQFSAISQEINTQLARDTLIHITELRPLMPDLHVEVTAGTDNILHTYLSEQNIYYNELYAEIFTSPEEGLSLDAELYGFRRDTLRLDSISLHAVQDTLGLVFGVDVIKKRYRNQKPFTASIQGSLRDTYADAEINYRNEEGETGLLLGARATLEQGGINLHLIPYNTVIAFRDFTLNEDNYILYRSTTDIEANVRLTGENNAYLWIHSTPETGTMQSLEAEISQFSLQDITEGFPGLPLMEGMLSADIQYTPVDSTFQIVAYVHVDTLIYEGGRVGEIALNGTYIPMNDGEQQVDVHLARDGGEIMSATGSYRSGTPDNISGDIDFHALPLSMVSPFIPDDMIALSGALNGHMTIEGSTQAPDLNGYLQMDTAALFVTAAGSSFRLDSQRIEVTQSLIAFNQYKIYGADENPFTVDGNVDISNLARITADLDMNANNMELLNADRTAESLVYGRLLVDLSASVQGPVNALDIRGNLHILGNTNVTYVLTDSPLTVQDRMDGLVTFVSFADTFTIRDRNPQPAVPLGGMDILFTVSIDQATQLNVDLTADQSNRIEVIGGGDLSFQSSPQGDLVLNGRYTISGGTVSYTLPVVPLKDFNIHEDSYVEWTGDIMNPAINLTATEQVRTSVVDEGGGSRLVSFNVGIVVTQTLENLSLQFTIDAPEDMEIQNELASMGQEEQSRQAVGMLITGRYLAGGSGGNMNFDMGSALNSFLQNEIGNLAGDALKTVDISFDMDTYNDNGEARTDYSFRFAKRFYNDRIQVVIGGRVSSGGDANTGQSQSFIDDISLEYRLDQTGTRFVRVFHDKTYESLLEGELVETGVGLVLRKKMRYLRELFIFRKNKNKAVSEETKEVALR